MARLRWSLLLPLLAAGPAWAQHVSRVDFGDVQARTTDAASPYYFPKLLARLQQADTTLQRQDYYYLYYGQVYAPGYEPYAADAISPEFLQAYEAKQNEQALALGQAELQQHPFNLKLRLKVLVCCTRLGNRRGGSQCAQPYYGFLYTIIGSGDGHSVATAFVPVAVADEYAVLGYYDLTWNRQALQGQTDVFTLTGTHEPPRDERHTFTGPQIYFDASRSLQQLAGELSGSPNRKK